MKKEFEVVTKDLNGYDWETQGTFKTLKQAISFAKKIDKNSYADLDINLIIDDDLKDTYDINGKVR